MKKLTLFLALAIIVAKNVSAQSAAANTDTTKNLQNAWYAEFAGQSLLGVTFNYERFISSNPGGLSVHVGIGGGYIPDILDDGGTIYGAAPFGISYSLPVSPDKRHMIEFGGVYTILFAEGSSSFVSGIIGWRHESASRKTIIRVTLMPINKIQNDNGTFGPWVGFSIGQRF